MDVALVVPDPWLALVGPRARNHLFEVHIYLGHCAFEDAIGGVFLLPGFVLRLLGAWSGRLHGSALGHEAHFAGPEDPSPPPHLLVQVVDQSVRALRPRPGDEHHSFLSHEAREVGLEPHPLRSLAFLGTFGGGGVLAPRPQARDAHGLEALLSGPEELQSLRLLVRPHRVHSVRVLMPRAGNHVGVLLVFVVALLDALP